MATKLALRAREALQLEMVFEYGDPRERILHRVAGPSTVALGGDQPSPDDLALLMDRVQWMAWLAGETEDAVVERSVDPDDVAAILAGIQFERRRSRTVVRRMSMASPLDLHLALAIASPPAMGVLLYSAKRLFALDLILKSYREKMAAEYETQRAAHLEAKRIADALEAENATVPRPAYGWTAGAQPRMNWSAVSGTLTDPNMTEDG